MSGETRAKSWVSLLQEFCAKKRLIMPVYDYEPKEKIGFECCVRYQDCNGFAFGFGYGRTKRVAKHIAAENVLHKLFNEGSFGAMHLNLFQPMQHNKYQTIPTRQPQLQPQPPLPPPPPVESNGDMILQLRNYCVRQHQPIAMCDVTHQKTIYGGHMYTAICKMRDVQTTAQAEDAMSAKQLAAQYMMRHFKVGDVNEYNFPGPKCTVVPEAQTLQHTKMFIAFSEFSEAGWQCVGGRSVALCDGSNILGRSSNHLKEAAFAVINRPYDNARQQAFDLLNALGLGSSMTIAPPSTEPMIMLQLDCNFDAFFIGTATNVYRNIIDYFSVILL